jgi:hypothetical protein
MTREGQFLQPGEFKPREENESEFWNMMKVCPMLKKNGREIHCDVSRNEGVRIGSEFSS